MQTLDEMFKAEDYAVLQALAGNMTLAGANDINDNLYWLRRHYAAVGIAGTVDWYVRCAVSRETDPFIQQLDWKQGIADACKRTA